jgi:SAM-dependent methyltransferase
VAREIASAGELLEVGNHFAARAVQVAVRFGVWDALEAGACGAAELALLLGTEARATGLLCDALVALGLLRKRDGVYALTAWTAEHLVRGKPGYDGGLVLMDDACWNDWGRLDEAVRTGKLAGRARLFHEDPARTELLLRALWRRALRMAPPLVEALALAGEGRLLDVGGGLGGFTAALLRAAPGWRATLFDLPQVAAMARAQLASEGLAAHVDVVEGDFHRDALPGGHDLVLLAAIVHGNSPEQNAALMKKCAAALNPGGRVVVRDYLMSDDLTDPAPGALFALQMLLVTEGGRDYSVSEIGSWMREAGLVDVQVFPPGAMAMAARKPL